MQASRPRKAVKLSRTIQQHLNQYTLSACATGVSALALAQPAQAEIIYTPAHKALPINNPFYLNLNHDGTKDFRFFLHSIVSSGIEFHQLKVEGVNSKNGVWSYVSSSFRYPCAAALPKGTKVTSKSPFKQGYVFLFSVGSSFGGAGEFCPWLSFKVGKQAYLGLKFFIKGKVHFGWARVGNIHSGLNGKVSAELMGYAYETIPGKAITAGATKGPEDNAQPAAATTTSPTSAPATLGMLALGAPGLSIWRREELAIVTPQTN